MHQGGPYGPPWGATRARTNHAVFGMSALIAACEGAAHRLLEVDFEGTMMASRALANVEHAQGVAERVL